MITEIKNIRTGHQKILYTLSYSQIFDHPLTKEELSARVELTEDANLEFILDDLIEKGIIHKFGEYYTVNEDRELVKKRQKEEALALKYLRIARISSKVIYLMPFVRAVYISGSLSKGRVHKGGDIDFFIITKRNRLWIARMIVILIKKTILLGSFKYFCVNYFVDEDNLEGIDKNMFTATETVTLLPIRGAAELYENFKKSNQWIKTYYPDFLVSQKWKTRKGFLKWLSENLFEFLLELLPLEKLDKKFMEITYKRWSNLFKETFSKEDFEVAFKTYRGISKNHRGNYQTRVDKKLKEIYDPLIEKYNTNNSK